MRFGDDERAQSILVGAILLFAILIIAFSSYQAFVVPNQNAEVEFNHNIGVQSDIQDLRNSLLDVRSVERIDEGDYSIVSEHRPVRVRLGARYPERLIALNPPAPSGTLRTDPAESEFRIENATVDDAAIDGEFHQDPNGLLGENPSANLETTFLLYRPEYAEYQRSPVTVLEHSLLYNDFQSAEIPIRQQAVIQPGTNRLNIVLFEGDVSRSGAQAVTLDPQTLDGPTDPIPIESAGGPITIQIPTRSPMVWNRTVTQLDDVTLETAPTPEDTHVRVTLDASRYDLRITRVGFDSDASVADQQLTPLQIEDARNQRNETDGNGTASTFDTRWIQHNGENIESDTVTVNPGDDVELTMRAVERGSDPEIPIENAAVDFSTEGNVDGDVLAGSDPVGNVTDPDGEQRFELEIADTAENGDEFRAYTTAGDDSDVVKVQVNATDDPNQPDSENIEVVPGSEQTFWGTDGVEFQLENTGEGSITITALTIDSTSRSQVVEVSEANGGSYAQGQHEVYIDGSTDGVLDMGGTPYWDDDGTPLPIGSTEPLTEPATLDAQTTATASIYAFRNTGGQIRDMSGETITLTLEFGDGSTGTYQIVIN